MRALRTVGVGALLLLLGGLGYVTMVRLRPAAGRPVRQVEAVEQRDAMAATDPLAAKASPLKQNAVAHIARPAAQKPVEYYPRPPEEWQGMLVDLSVASTCDETIHCGLAQVCRDGRCLPCRKDEECESGSVCVLDHCVAEERVSCRLRRDCGGRAACVLSGYSSDPRGNADLRAFCVSRESGLPAAPETQPPERDPSTIKPSPSEELLKVLEQEEGVSGQQPVAPSGIPE